jgi:flagellar P-ring protein precursor FlgI
MKKCLMLLLALAAFSAHAQRIKDLASVRGVRDNALIGYGLVMGLDGTGDATQQTPFTAQSMNNLLQRLGLTLPPGASFHARNVAAVIITAQLPAFARPGQTLDITVSSMGNAKSLRGGTLLMTPLKAANGDIYALAQGNVVIGGAGAAANGSQVTVNQLASGRIPAGAIVEKAVDAPLGEDGLALELRHTDFGTASRVAEAVNRAFGEGTARALDGRVIQLQSAQQVHDPVGFLARLESINVVAAQPLAKVVINARTGSVVMNQAVRLDDSAVAHGSLSVVIDTEPVISQPNALSGGNTVATQRSRIELSQGGGTLQAIKGGALLSDVVRGLNALGANSQDLISILQALKAAGSLKAELEII